MTHEIVRDRVGASLGDHEVAGFPTLLVGVADHVKPRVRVRGHEQDETIELSRVFGCDRIGVAGEVNGVVLDDPDPGVDGCRGVDRQVVDDRGRREAETARQSDQPEPR